MRRWRLSGESFGVSVLVAGWTVFALSLVKLRKYGPALKPLVIGDATGDLHFGVMGDLPEDLIEACVVG